MRHRRSSLPTSFLPASAVGILAALLVVALTLPAAAADPDFVEPDVTVLARYQAENPGDRYGYVGARIGDLDGDGAAEYVVTAPFHSGAAFFGGKAYVYDGASGALIHTVLGDFLEVLGWSAACGGDADGDGVPDYAVGGRAFGPVGGRVLLLSGADHSVLLDLRGEPGAAFGLDVGFAGDVDGDGLDDLVVGSRFDSRGGPDAGRLSVHSSRDGSLLWERLGEPGDRLGASVTGLGDLDGDGVPEQAAGASDREVEIGDFTRTGIAFVYDGATGATRLTLEPRPTAGSFGLFFIHDAGDRNGDGRSEIFVGDLLDDFAGVDAGAAYLFDGTSGARLKFIPGEEAGDQLGIGRGAGDVDGDGFPDLVLGAWRSSAGAELGGRCYVRSGRNAGILRTFTSTVPDARLGFDALALGDVDGDGLTDYLLTGSGLAWVVAGTPFAGGGH